MYDVYAGVPGTRNEQLTTQRALSFILQGMRIYIYIYEA